MFYCWIYACVVGKEVECLQFIFALAESPAKPKLDFLSEFVLITYLPSFVKSDDKRPDVGKSTQLLT